MQDLDLSKNRFRQGYYKLAASDHDKLYENVKGDKVILNYFDGLDNDVKKRLDNLIISKYAKDNISLIPQCSCGELHGGYYVGNVCSSCGTTVISSVDDHLSYLIWLKRPEGVEKFVSPYIMHMLSSRYKIPKVAVNLIEYLVSPRLKIQRKGSRNNNEGELRKLDILLEMHGISRGYNSFVQNFYKIVELLEENFAKSTINKADKVAFLEFLHGSKNTIFSEYLPFINKAIVVIDSNELGNYIDKSLFTVVNVIRKVTGIDLGNKKTEDKQLRVAKSLLDLGAFYHTYMHQSLFKKYSLIRQQISSARCHFTARAVITSIHQKHRYDEIHLPWSLACTLFREHILSVFRKMGYSFKRATSKFMTAIKVFDQEVSDIFDELLKTPVKHLPGVTGIAVLFNRNPSLHRGSIQALVVTKIKRIIRENTISMSYLIAKSFNADFDGDALNLTLPLTKKSRAILERFMPHHNILSATGPNEFSGVIGFPKTITSLLAAFYNYEGDDQ